MDILIISNYLVVVAGFITPVILFPQIMRVIRLKESRAVSLLTLMGSWLIQVNLFINAFLNNQQQIMIAMALSIIPLTILIFVVKWHR